MSAKDVIEAELIEEFHWLPQDIAKIPLKKLQIFFTIRRQRGISQQSKEVVEREKKKAQEKGKIRS